MLKHIKQVFINSPRKAATFGWLCVETAMPVVAMATDYAATFGWLCVETFRRQRLLHLILQPPSGGCVLKPLADYPIRATHPGSHLRVAVC